MVYLTLYTSQVLIWLKSYSSVGNIIVLDDKDFSYRYTVDYLIRLLFL